MRKSIWLLSAGLFALAAPVAAQTTDTDGTAAKPAGGSTAEGSAVSTTGTATTAQVDTGDIVVTATRRNQALSDVPLAVSAVTAESLANTGASDIRQMQQVSPSLLVSSTQSEGGASTARIRGIGTVGDNPGLESSVGVFIDGVYRSRTGVGLSELGAVDRIEVLRGPQGTLFGRNTSAGLISIITAKPKFNTEISGELTAGNYNLRRGSLSATGGLSDTIAVRFDGVYLKRDGFLKDLISGRDVNNRDRFLLRGQALFQPTDSLSFRLVADYSKRNEECCAAPFLPASDAILTGPGTVTRGPSTAKPLVEALSGVALPDNPFKRDVTISRGRSYRGDVRDGGISGELNYDFGGAELTSITAYRDNKLIRGTDVDYNALDLVYRPDDGTAFNRFKTFSQEARLQGTTFGGKLDWLVGGYYANEKLNSRDSLRYGNDYGRLANCLVAANFAASPLIPDNIVAPSSSPSGTCFQPAIAQGVFNNLVAGYNAAVLASNIPLATALAGQAGTLAAFARLNASGFGPSPVNYTLPIFTNSGFQNIAIANPFAPDFSFANAGFIDDFRQNSNNIAVFTHNIFSITDALKLTVGARYTRETKRLVSNLTDNNLGCAVFSGTALAQLPCANPSVPGGNIDIDGKKTESKLSGTAVLSFKPTDQLLTYVSYSRGYKAGGFNLDRSALTRRVSLNSSGQPIAGAVCPTSGTLPTGCARYASAKDLEFRPETNDAIELGAKYNGRGFDVNVAVFHQLFKDFQLNTFNGVNFIVENIESCSSDLNGADTDNNPNNGACPGKTRAGVRSQGVEVEIFTRPFRDFSFNLGTTYADSKYRKNLVGAGGRALTNALFQLPGRRLSNAAVLTVTSAVTWTPPIGSSGMHGLAYLDVRHQSKYNTGSDLDIEKVENGYTVFNARLGLRGPDDAWGVELWAQNLFNEKYKQIAFDAFLQGSGTQRGVEQGFYTRSNQLYGVFLADPRTYGITLRGKFAPKRPAPPEYVAPPAPPPPPAMQTCADGSVILASDTCPPPPAPPPPPPPAPAPTGERGR